MKKFIYIIVALLALSGCGGGATQSTNSYQQNQSPKQNSERSLDNCSYVNPINGNCEK